MVEARFSGDGAGQRLTVTGHATGSEATCAAVSCLVQTLETALEDFVPGGHKKSIKKGSVAISAPHIPVADLIFWSFRHSFLRLAAADPERVRVIEEEDNDGI